MKNLSAFLVAFFCFIFCMQPLAFAAPSDPSMPPALFRQKWKLVDQKNFELPAKPAKGYVLVFLSAKCPCSNSHIPELAKLKSEFPAFQFIGIHSNPDESKEMTESYFLKAQLPFPVVQDEKTQLADQMKAFKTPHAYVLSADYKIVYEGGVSSSHALEDAEEKYLRLALEQLNRNETPQKAKTRTLGCAISRGEHVW